MRIRILCFGVLRELVPDAEQLLELKDSATAGSVLDHYRALAPSALWASVALAVNRHYAAAEQPLAEGDEVALLPPVSGGSGGLPGLPAAVASAFLTREPIEAASIAESIKAGADGAVVVFEGIVRNNTRGRQTIFLEYEAYEAMAVTRMGELIEQACARFAVREARMVHRLGRIEIGRTSVLIAVASAHRAAAFEACRWLIDTLKTTVPIWKKEHFADGAVWSEGEPFPPEFAAAPSSASVAASLRFSGGDPA